MTDHLSVATSTASHQSAPRIERELIKATAPYAVESTADSWWAVGSTFVLLIAAMTAAGLPLWWPARLVFSVLAGLLMVRAFITYHDYLHGSILRESKLARLIFELYGALSLTPPRSWKKSHNYHHGHIGQLEATGIGSFRVMTAKAWRQATAGERALYRIERHPLTVLFAYLTGFGINTCLLPLLTEPKKHWDSALSLIAHGGLIAALWWFGGFSLAFFVVLLPMAIASALGGYLFFAQHSYKDMVVLPPESWAFQRAALESSSYLKLNRLMAWFTGNIGYHHIHHLNIRIPFYRLPEAMAAIPELQSPATISLCARDIRDCFNADLWDEDRQRMISFSEV